MRGNRAVIDDAARALREQQVEAQRMVTEKMVAAAEAAMTLATGGTAERVVRDYRRKVRANARRLSQG